MCALRYLSSLRAGVLLLLILAAPTAIITVNALSSPTSRQFIELTSTNPLTDGLPNERLPVSFVANWPTWVILLEAAQDSDSKEISFTKIPDANDEGGFVSPVSIDELWQPVDLKQPQCRLALGLHVRDGIIRHVYPAVDLSFDDGHHGMQHRNRGLCSVPVAFSWMDFPSFMAGGMQNYSLLLKTRKQQGDKEWDTLIKEGSIRELLNGAIQALADQPPEKLGDGSNLIHVLCKEGSTVECPKPGYELCSVLKEDGCVVVGLLQVSIDKTAAGSESEYLPEAYRSLFEDKSLQRPAFIEAKKRMARKDRLTFE